MKDYVKYSSSSNYREIGLSHGVTTLALMSLMEFVTSLSWEVRDLLTSYVDIYFMSPPYKGGSMYRPYTCYRGSDIIGYYDPDLGPPPDPGQGVNVTWYEVQESPAATVQHTAAHIADVYPGWSGAYFTPTNGYGYGIRISNFHSGPESNGQEFYPNPSMGAGGLTYYGGYKLRTATYNGYYAEMDIYDHPVYRFSVDVNFGGSTPTYQYKLGGYTQWNCFANPYQLIMIADGTCGIGDLSGYSKGFLLSLPYLPSLDPDRVEIKSRIDYCGVVCGGLDTKGYISGDITLNTNLAKSKIRLNHSILRSGELPLPTAYYSDPVNPYTITDSGLQFPVMRTLQDLMMVNGIAENPITNPAYLSLPRFPGIVTCPAQVVGNLWDSFAVTQYIPRGTEIILDGKIWQCIISQGENTLRQTPGSIFVLKEE